MDGFILVHGMVFCHDCNQELNCTQSNASKIAREHHHKTGHHVKVELGFLKDWRR